MQPHAALVFEENKEWEEILEASTDTLTGEFTWADGYTRRRKQ